MFQRALSVLNVSSHDAKKTDASLLEASASAATHVLVCKSGIARNLIRTGDIRSGVAVALEIDDAQLYRSAAAILEELKQWTEAASFYEKAESFEKAACIHIQNKNFAAAKPLLEHVRSSRLHILYAKWVLFVPLFGLLQTGSHGAAFLLHAHSAKEAEGNMAEAALSYEAAEDYVDLVRLYLDRMNRPQDAADITRQRRLPEAALLVAKYCQAHGDMHGAIEFNLLAKRNAAAFQVAKAHGEVKYYAEMLGENGTMEEMVAIAEYYAERG